MAELRHVAIGIHSTGNMPDEMVFHLVPAMMRAAKRLEGTHFSFVGVSKSKVAASRNKIIEGVLGMGCSHWLSIDTDHVLQLDTLERLAVSCEEDVGLVSGLIHKRSYPFHQVAFRFLPGTDGHELVQINPKAGVVEVDACAFGCTLVNVEAIAAKGLPVPWFRDTERGRSDMNFCRAVRGLGLRVLVDARLTVGHIMDAQVLWPENVDEARLGFKPPEDAA